MPRDDARGSDTEAVHAAPAQAGPSASAAAAIAPTLSTEEAAAALSVSRQTLIKWRSVGDWRQRDFLKSWRAGWEVRWPVAGINALIAHLQATSNGAKRRTKKGRAA